MAAPSGHWPLKWFPMAAPSGHWPLKWFPMAAPSGHWPLKWFPMAAPSGHWPPKWFPMAANEWRSPLPAGRVGAYCIRPRYSKQETAARGRKAPIKWFPTAAPSGHWPIKWYPMAANEWRSPLSAGRVGAYCIRPRCSKQETAACGREAPIKCFPTAAPSGQRLPKCFPTAANEWRSPLSAGRVGAYCIRPRCSKQETAACVREAPINWYPMAAPSGQQPL